MLAPLKPQKTAAVITTASRLDNQLAKYHDILTKESRYSKARIGLGSDMASWSVQTEQRFRKAGLFEPKSKMAKLRAALPTIEAALTNGYTYEQCVEHLKLSGLDITLHYFRYALGRVRKMQPLAGDIAANEERQKAGNIQGKVAETNEPKESRVVSASGSTIVTKKVRGVVISTVEKKDHLTNRNPRLEDFI